MGAVEYVVALEQQMELVPLKRGWWVAFGGPRQPAMPPVAHPAGDVPGAPSGARADAAEPDASEPPHGPRGGGRMRAGTVPPSEPKRRRQREPQPPSPRPMPDPAPSPVPDPPSTPDMPPSPRASRGGRR